MIQARRRCRLLVLLPLAACGLISEPHYKTLPEGSTEITRPEFAAEWEKVTACSKIALPMATVKFYLAPYPLEGEAGGLYFERLRAIVFSESMWTTRDDIPQFNETTRDDLIRHEMLHAKLFALGSIGHGHPRWILDRCGPDVVNPTYWHDPVP